MEEGKTVLASLRTQPERTAPGIASGRDSLPGAATSVVLIPAYKPSTELLHVVEELLSIGVQRIVVVDDGSGPSYEPLFEAVSEHVEVSLLRHAVNLGKGAALKTGINAILCGFPEVLAIVTADADGQHAPADIRKVMAAAHANPGRLVLGSRDFGRSVPLRSRLGNQITRSIFSLLVGHRLRDTQTGLRAIPSRLLAHLLRLHPQGYDFELDMLIAAKDHGVAILEVPIETIYLDGNRSSHFNPLLDSMRIYFVLLRFAAVSMMTALLDNTVFILVFWLTGKLGLSQVCGRLVAVAFNYQTVKRAVFFSNLKHREALLKYLALVVFSGFVSFELIRLFVANFPIGVVPAKLLAETLLFFVNFLIQRDFVFRKESDPPRQS